MKKLILLGLIVSIGVSAQTLTFTNVFAEGSSGLNPNTTPPFGNQWTRIQYLPGSDYTVMNVYGGGETTQAIYSNNIQYYRPTTLINVGTAIGTGNCIAGTSSWPGNKHPYNTGTGDSKRNFYWSGPGVCTGTPVTEMYYLDVAAQTWHQVTPTHLSAAFSQAWTYDKAHDVLIAAVCNVSGACSGHQETWVYASTVGNPGGVLTAAQLLVPGVVADDWFMVSSNTGPTGLVIPLFTWDTIHNQAILFGGYNNQTPSGPMTETWTYEPVSNVWTNKAPSNTPSTTDNYSGVVGYAGDWDSISGVMRYILPKITGSTVEDWYYDPTANSWTQGGSYNSTTLGAFGSVNEPTSMAIDTNRHQMVLWCYQFNSGDYQIWTAPLPASGTITAQARVLASWPSGNVKWSEICGELATFTGGGTATTTITGSGLNVPLTVQEALYPGGPSGVSRTNAPFCQGFPIADSANVTSVSNLALSGTTAVSNTNMAVDNGTTITVATGTATITLKKANHNGFDIVDVGLSHVVLTGASDGFAIVGPLPTATFPANVTCTPTSGGSACATVYLSKNDSGSTCSIEKNGGIAAVVRCTWTYIDGAAHTYMGGTARYYFYAGKTDVKITTSLRNADYGLSATFANSFKGFKSNEFRVKPNISGTFNYNVAVDSTQCTSGVCSGTMTTSDTVNVYQAQSAVGAFGDCGTSCMNAYTIDTGYVAKKNGSALATGGTGVAVGGWADIADSGGMGVEIGVFQLTQYWPKSLEFNTGNDVRIGIWPGESSGPYYFGYPQYDIQDLWVNFHATSVSSPRDEYQKFNSYLLARASVSQYNSSSVFPYPMVDATVENNYYTAVGNASNPSIPVSSFCCITDIAPFGYKAYLWAQGSGTNQVEFRWSDLQNFLRKGFTGRWLNSRSFYIMEAEKSFPRADGFTWRSKPIGPEVDQSRGFPFDTTTNNSLFFTDYVQDSAEHDHYWGINDYYMMTGDENIHDAILDGYLNYFLDTRTYNSGQVYFGGYIALTNTRALGSHLTSGVALQTLLLNTGDSHQSGELSYIDTLYTNGVLPQLCTGANCNPNVPPSTGQSFDRGDAWTGGSAGLDNQCTPSGTPLPSQHYFFPTTLAESIWRYKAVKGSGWGGYVTATDYIDGITNYLLHEFEVNDGSGQWTNNGWRYNVQLTVPNNCGSGEYDAQSSSEAMFMTYWFRNQIYGGTPWTADFNFALDRDANALGLTTSDFGQYQIANTISAVVSPGSTTLQTTTVTSFVDNGGGSYTVGWDTPSGTTNLRGKWGLTQIVDWIGFNATTGAFIGNPTTTQNWFASNEISMPSPVVGGQTVTVATGQTGLTAQDFMIKAMAPAFGPSTGGSMIFGKSIVFGKTTGK